MNGRKLKHELWLGQLLINSGPIFKISRFSLSRRIKLNIFCIPISNKSYKNKTFSKKNESFETK